METTSPSLPAELGPILSGSKLGDALFTWLPGEQVPEPFRGLLVHDHDMTSELARFHGDSINLTVLRSQEKDGLYLREVTLHAARCGKPVEYGLIAILLESFPEDLRPRILAGSTPLGAILNESGLAYGSEPQGFFHIPTERLSSIFPESSGGANLFGRYNHLVRDDGRCLARIIEILPTEPACDQGS
ncbi:hypothetical protein HAHE_11360 [Haloferula helveola]|uniref:Chorismate lyase n=1 Tax=Haloferula helveola TaxID=490095 RepID=A0ABM7REA1_9BACT|nr:hypothetical protein HAHE_11360 [Haloferula helveola]